MKRINELINIEINRQTTKSLCRVFSSVHVERTRETEEENKEMRPMLHLRRLQAPRSGQAQEQTSVVRDSSCHGYPFLLYSR